MNTLKLKNFSEAGILTAALLMADIVIRGAVLHRYLAINCKVLLL